MSSRDWKALAIIPFIPIYALALGIVIAQFWKV